MEQLESDSNTSVTRHYTELHQKLADLHYCVLQLSTIRLPNVHYYGYYSNTKKEICTI